MGLQSRDIGRGGGMDRRIPKLIEFHSTSETMYDTGP